MDQDRPLELDALQRRILLQQIDFFSRANPDLEAQQAYRELKDAVAAGSVPADLLPRFEAILEASLAGDLVRRAFGAGAADSIYALFQKTPRGQADAAEVEKVNLALARLADQQLGEIKVTQLGLGSYALQIEAEECRLTVGFGPRGVRIETLEERSEDE